jgi:predicted DNA-binding transcriptional regulator AlpA
MERRLLTLTDVIDKVAMSKSYIYQMAKKGAFPKPVKLWLSSRWVESEIDDWIEARIAERDSRA